jgi:hypothetical protein
MADVLGMEQENGVKAKHPVQSLLSVSLIMGVVVLGMPQTVSAQGEIDIVEAAVAVGSL